MLSLQILETPLPQVMSMSTEIIGPIHKHSNMITLDGGGGGISC